MFLRRRIKYQLGYYYKILISVGRCLTPPWWLIGKGVRVICLCVLIAVAVLYVAEISRAAGSGYEMKILQKQVSELRTKIQKIDVEIASQNSMSNLVKRLQETDLVTVKNIKYVVVFGPDVAKK